MPAKLSNYESLSFLSENELNQLLETASGLHVTPELENPHRILQKHQVAFKKWTKRHPRDKYADWNHDKYRRKPEEEPPLWNSVTLDTLPRVYMFLDPLFRAIEKLGGKINPDLSMKIRNELVVLQITEGRDIVPHIITVDEQQRLEEYKKEKKKYSYLKEPSFRKYDYIPNGKLKIRTHRKTFIRDTDSARVEDRIGDALIALYIQSEDVRIEREKKEEAKRIEEEENKQKALLRLKHNEEVEKLKALNNKVDDFETASRIRAFIAFVESNTDPDQETLEWIAWAKAKADWYDPAVAAKDPIFGVRDHGADPKDKTPVIKNPYYFEYYW